jgi:hypothetical protein
MLVTQLSDCDFDLLPGPFGTARSVEAGGPSEAPLFPDAAGFLRAALVDARAFADRLAPASARSRRLPGAFDGGFLGDLATTSSS